MIKLNTVDGTTVWINPLYIISVTGMTDFLYIRLVGTLHQLMIRYSESTLQALLLAVPDLQEGMVHVNIRH